MDSAVRYFRALIGIGGAGFCRSARAQILRQRSSLRACTRHIASRLIWTLLAVLAPAVWAGGTLAEPPAQAKTMSEIKAYKRSEHIYLLPEKLKLQRADGQTLAVGQALANGRPVVLTFMYSSCATICPITNQTLIGLGQLMGSGKAAVNLVSISIDPDHDSVTQLQAYAKKTGAVGGFYTSDPASTESIQRVFDVWRGDKMHHQPVFLLSMPPHKLWVRLDGLISPRELFLEYQRLTAAGG